MAEDKISDYILGCMKNLNLIVVVYLSGLICYALTGFAEENTALDFLIMDYNLLSIRYDITSLEVCLTYFCSDAQAVLLVLKNVLGSLNILIFILYMVVLIRAQMSEKERILDLNEELNVANDKLTQAYAQLEAYAKESERAAEARERNRLAREIHDTLGHTLTGIITGLDACTMLVDIAPEAAKKQLEVIGNVARQGMTDVRRSVKALRPDALERLDLEDALLHMIDEMRSAAGAQIEYQCTAGLKCFDQENEEMEKLLCQPIF